MYFKTVANLLVIIVSANLFIHASATTVIMEEVTNDFASFGADFLYVDQAVLAVGGGRGTILLELGPQTPQRNKKAWIYGNSTITIRPANIREAASIDCSVVQHCRESMCFRYHPSFVVSNNGTLIISDITVRNCHGSVNPFVLAEQSGHVTFRNVTFEDNYASSMAPVAMAAGESTLTFENCTFRNNVGKAGGSAIACTDSDVTVTNSVFEGNVGRSGVFDLDACNLTLSDVIANNNSGAAIVVSSSRSNVVMDNVVMNDNKGTDGCILLAENGGTNIITNAIFHRNTGTISGSVVTHNSALTMTNVSMIDNVATAGDGGAVRHDSSAPLFLSNCHFESNNANQAGGAISIVSGPAGTSSFTLEDVTIINNVAKVGGGLNVEGGIDSHLSSLALEAVTVRDNEALILGGGIFLRNVKATFDDVTVHKNLSPTTGGGLFAAMSNLKFLDDTTLSNNVAPIGAGGHLVDSSIEFAKHDDKRDVAAKRKGPLFVENNIATTSGGGLYLEGNSQFVGGDIDGGVYVNNTAGAGGALFFDVTKKKEKYLPKNCDTCSDNEALYGDDLATPPRSIAVDDDMSSDYNNLDHVRAKMMAVDSYGHVAIGVQLSFNLSTDPPSSILVDLDHAASKAVPLTPAITTDGEVTVNFGLVDHFNEKVKVVYSAFTLGNNNLHIDSHEVSVRVEECDDDEYLSIYPPGIGVFDVCKDVDYVDRTDARYVLQIVFGTLTGICMLLTLFIMAVIIVYRERKVITYASPMFCVMICIGVLMGYLAVIFFIVEPSDPTCVIQVIFVLLAFGMTMGPLVVKNWRVYRLFNNNSLKVRRISNLYLLKMVSVIIIIELVLIGFWMGFSTPESEYEYDDDRDDERILICSTPNNIILGISIGINCVILICALFLAIKTHDIVEGFNEAKWVAIILYSFAIVGALVIPLVILVDDVDFRLVLLTSSIFFCTSFLFFGLFTPKVIVLFTGADLKAEYADTMAWNSRANRKYFMGTNSGQRASNSAGGPTPRTENVTGSASTQFINQTDATSF